MAAWAPAATAAQIEAAAAAAAQQLLATAAPAHATIDGLAGDAAAGQVRAEALSLYDCGESERSKLGWRVGRVGGGRGARDGALMASGKERSDQVVWLREDRLRTLDAVAGLWGLIDQVVERLHAHLCPVGASWTLVCANITSNHCS